MIWKFENCLPLFCALILVSGCAREEDEVLPIEEEEPQEIVIAPFRGVDEDLWVYFHNFEQEAALRGISVDLRRERIIGEISALHEDGVAGQCSYSNFFPGQVTIDEDFWNRASDRAREFVVFHELGHCSLGREHREDAFPNGICKSLMRSGAEDCRDNYRSSTRSLYLDELFDDSFFNEIN